VAFTPRVSMMIESVLLQRVCTSASDDFFVCVINSSANGVECAMFAELFCKFRVTQEELLFSL
jgi:hypothetical protein